MSFCTAGALPQNWCSRGDVCTAVLYVAAGSSWGKGMVMAKDFTTSAPHPLRYPCCVLNRFTLQLLGFVHQQEGCGIAEEGSTAGLT